MTRSKMAGDDDGKSACYHGNVTSSSDVSSSPVCIQCVRFLAPVAALVTFNLVVIVGNSFVIAAVFTHRTLRTVTNTFIVSLAVSDLLLGAVVLPFSSVNEVLGWWPFGRVWCSAWLAIDVWVCTASILNLCAISLDRYLAISRPFRYPLLMSPTRAKVAVAVVWSLALAICLPPLLGWRDSSATNAHMTSVTDVDLVDHTVITLADDRNLGHHQSSSFSFRTADAHYVASVDSKRHATAKTVSKPKRSNSMPLTSSVVSAIYNKHGVDLIRNAAALSSVQVARNTSDHRQTSGISGSDVKSERVKNGETSDWNFVFGLRPVDEVWTTAASVNACRVADSAPRPVCMLTSEPGYIIYSACGSFWIPMLVMVFFYVKIYRTAVKATSALSSGVLTKKTRHRLAADSQVVAVNLRVHRGGGGAHTSRASYWTSPASDRLMAGNMCNSLTVRRPSRDRGVTQDLAVTTGPDADDVDRSCHLRTDVATGCCMWSKTSPRVSSSSQHANHGVADCNHRGICTSTEPSNVESASLRRRRLVARSSDSDSAVAVHAPVPEEGIESLVQSTVTPMFDQCSASARRSSRGCGNAELVDESHAHAGRRFVQIRAQLRRLNREKKAAKTVGVIVGCFILCWAPFFTVYVLGVFCADCTPPVAFVVFFWLGYCNSAINPFVYALCSKDFRSAFRRLLRCGRASRHGSNRTIAALVSGLRSPARRAPAGDTVFAATARLSPNRR